MSFKRRYETISQAENFSYGLDSSTVNLYQEGMNTDFALTMPPSLDHRDLKVQQNIMDFDNVKVCDNISIGDITFILDSSTFLGKNEGLPLNLPLLEIVLWKMSRIVGDILYKKEKAFFSKINKKENLFSFYNVLNENAEFSNQTFFGVRKRGRNSVYSYPNITNYLKKEVTDKYDKLKNDSSDSKPDFNEDDKEKLENFSKYTKENGTWEDKEKWIDRNESLYDYISIASLTQKIHLLGVCDAPEDSANDYGYKKRKYENGFFNELETTKDGYTTKKTNGTSNAFWNRGSKYCFAPVRFDEKNPSLFYTGLLVLKFEEVMEDSNIKGDDGKLVKIKRIQPYMECIEARDYIAYTWIDKQTGRFCSEMPIKIGRVIKAVNKNAYKSNITKYNGGNIEDVMNQYRKDGKINNCRLDVNYHKMV